MARQPRLVVPDLSVHVIQRGNDRMLCFRAEGDYLVYLALLRQLSQKHVCNVHAYCLMTNHIHILLTPGKQGACTALMHGLAQRYAHYFNRRYERTGTLWEGRFRSCLVQSAGYVLACYRYIEMNPVRAGMVAHPSAYPWSSYAANSGARVDPFVTPHPGFEPVGAAQYAGMMLDALAPEFLRRIRDATNGGYPLATEPLLAGLSATARRKIRPGRAGRRAKTQESVPDPDLFSGGAAS